MDPDFNELTKSAAGTATLETQCSGHSPPLEGHQSGGGKYWIRIGVRDWSGFGELEQFGRMGNANWVILGFRSQKCIFFSGPEPPISDLPNLNLPPL